MNKLERLVWSKIVAAYRNRSQKNDRMMPLAELNMRLQPAESPETITKVISKAVDMKLAKLDGENFLPFGE